MWRSPFTLNTPTVLIVIIMLVVTVGGGYLVNQGIVPIPDLSFAPTPTLPDRTINPIDNEITPALTLLPTSNAVPPVVTARPGSGSTGGSTKITPRPSAFNGGSAGTTSPTTAVPKDSSSIDVFLANGLLNLGKVICANESLATVNTKINQLDSTMKQPINNYVSCNNAAKSKGDTCINGCGTTISCLEQCGMTCEKESKTCTEAYSSTSTPAIEKFISDVSANCATHEISRNINKKPTLGYSACYTEPVN